MNAGARAGNAGALWALSALALVAMAAFVGLSGIGPPPCPFRALTGLPCATCGGTRAAVALLRLDVREALRLNPLAAVALPMFVASGLVAGALALLGRPVPEPRPSLPLRAAALAAIAANWVYLVAVGR
jgi:hypothetical protein